MGRPPKPWFRKSRNAWYVTLDGKAVRLGTDKKRAEKEFHRLMLNKGTVDRSKDTIAELCDLFLCDAETRLAKPTFKSYKYYLRDFCNMLGGRIASDLKPIDLARWLNAHEKWGQNTRSLATVIVKTWSRWCKKQKCLLEDPLADVPTTKTVRRKPPPKGALEAIVTAIINPRFKELVELSLLLGTRLGELRTLEASGIDLKARTATVTGKTGERKIPLPDRAIAVLEPLMKRWPDGPVLRNTIDRPWRSSAIHSQMRSVSKRAGVKGVVFHHTRGAFATRAIKTGVHPLLISKLLGHADPKIVYQYYEQLDDDDLRAAVDQMARTETSGTAPSSSVSGAGTPEPGS